MVYGASKKNPVLIGMPGAGKSTTGVLLAKSLSRNFLDTDLCMQLKMGIPLQTILESYGPQGFKKIEEQVVCETHVDKSVIATGGSVVYSERAMEHLRSMGILLYLKTDLTILEKRLNNMQSRGLVIRFDQSLADLYSERGSLYEHYADVVLETGDDNQDGLVKRILSELEKQ